MKKTKTDIVLNRVRRTREPIVLGLTPQKTIFCPQLDWGQGGKAPAELAIQILLQFTGEENAMQLYEEFMERFIAPVPPGGGIIRAANVVCFLQEKNIII